MCLIADSSSEKSGGKVIKIRAGTYFDGWRCDHGHGMVNSKLALSIFKRAHTAVDECFVQIEDKCILVFWLASRILLKVNKLATFLVTNKCKVFKRSLR